MIGEKSFVININRSIPLAKEMHLATLHFIKIDQ